MHVRASCQGRWCDSGFLILNSIIQLLGDKTVNKYLLVLLFFSYASFSSSSSSSSFSASSSYLLLVISSSSNLFYFDNCDVCYIMICE